MSHSHQDIIAPLSIDCVIFGLEDARLQVLLIQRKGEPARHQWALPGGFILYQESIDAASRRILKEMTGVEHLYLEQLRAFGAVNRYPGRRVVTIAYYALIRPSAYALVPGLDTSGVEWRSVSEVPPLPFDHTEILHTAWNTLRQKVRHQPIGFELLPPKFTLRQLQELYEAILDTTLDKSNFRRKLMRMNLLEALTEFQPGEAHRPARLYRFDKDRYDALLKQGLHFEV